MDRSHYSLGLALDSLYLNRHLPHCFFFYSPNKPNGKSPLGDLVSGWLASRACFPSLKTDTLQMHKRIPVTGLMCGCQALLCTVVSLAGKPGQQKIGATNPSETWQKQLGFQPKRCQKISQDHGRISARG